MVRPRDRHPPHDPGTEGRVLGPPRRRPIPWPPTDLRKAGRSCLSRYTLARRPRHLHKLLQRRDGHWTFGPDGDGEIAATRCPGLILEGAVGVPPAWVANPGTRREGNRHAGRGLGIFVYHAIRGRDAHATFKSYSGVCGGIAATRGAGLILEGAVGVSPAWVANPGTRREGSRDARMRRGGRVYHAIRGRDARATFIPTPATRR